MLKTVLKAIYQQLPIKQRPEPIVLRAKKPKCGWIVFAAKISGNRHFVDLCKQFRKRTFFEQAECRLFI
jgi:hypothetical protein